MNKLKLYILLILLNLLTVKTFADDPFTRSLAEPEPVVETEPEPKVEEQAQQQTNLRSTLIDRLRNRPKAPAVRNGGTQNDACKGNLIEVASVSISKIFLDFMLCRIENSRMPIESICRVSNLTVIVVASVSIKCQI